MARQTGQYRQARGPRKAGCCESLLRFVYLVLNYLLLAMGLALIGYAIYIFYGVRHPHNLPPGSAGCKETASLRGHREESQSGYAAGAGQPESAWEDIKPYWFAYVILAMGVWTMITALFAISGVKCDKGCCLGVHTFMLGIALLAEGTFGFVFYYEKGWNWHLPSDQSGQCAQFRKLVLKHLRISIYIGIAAALLQFFSFLLGCALWSWVHERRQDDEEEAEIWRRQPLLNETGEGAGRDGGAPKRKTDTQKQRIREKYGVRAGR